MTHFLAKFFIRWLACALGLWIAAAILGPDKMSVGDSMMTVLFAGLFLAIVNMFLKPVLLILSIPAIILTLGIFMLVINGFLIMLASWIYEPLYIKNFWIAIIAGIIVGFVNYLVSHILKDLTSDKVTK